MKRLTRRTAIKTIGAIGTSLTIPYSALGCSSVDENVIRLGVIADLHGGLAIDADSRLDAFLAAMKGVQCDALVQLGDFAFPNNKHQSYADKFNSAHSKTLHVVGNHDLDMGLSRADCCQAWGIESSYYKRDIGNVRVLILDGNEKDSPTHRGGYPSYIGLKQQAWLENELETTTKPVLVLSHQPLAGHIAVDNAKAMQKLLSKFRKKIILCVNGHSHVDALVQTQGVSYLHINSASYFWVGGPERMAYYSDPLYTTLTIDPQKSTVTVQGKSSTWKADSPKDIGYFERKRSAPQEIVTPQIRPRQI